MVLAGAVAAAALLAAAGCGGSASAAYRSPTVAEAHAGVVARLDARGLSYHWVACVRTGRAYRGAAVVRCNVNFGDPHIEAYCGVLHGTRLVTQFDLPAIPCGSDRAGWSTPTVVGGG